MDDGLKKPTGETAEEAEAKLKKERLAHQQQQIDQMADWNKEQNKKFDEQVEEKNERSKHELEEKKDKVLEQQIISSQDKAQKFANILKKAGADGKEVNDLISNVEEKMANIEKLMGDDKERQNETLQRRLDARKNRRKKVQEKLEEVEGKILENEKETQVAQDMKVKEIQLDLQKELQECDEEDLKM